MGYNYLLNQESCEKIMVVIKTETGAGPERFITLKRQPTLIGGKSCAFSTKKWKLIPWN